MSELRRRLNYYAVSVKSLGCPPEWADDAAVDIWVTCWRRRDAGAGTVRSAAIDAVRRYRRWTQPAGLSYPPNQERTIDQLVDVRQAISRLTVRDRLAIEMAASGERIRADVWGGARYQARRKLRELCAA